ncbi:MAG: ketopantoate reductase family protein [Negativicutes bacterium]
MRIAIMGAGSLGTILGAYITRAGLNVDLIDANTKHVMALNANGATVTGTVKFSVKVTAYTQNQMVGVYDTVFYMVKQTYNETALNQLKEHLDENSTVCTLQNGIPEYAVSKVIGEKRVIGGVVGWGANLIGPGISELTTKEDALEIDIGEICGGKTDRLYLFQDVLKTMCKTNILDNLMGVRWNKILANAAMSGMSAALGCTFGDVLDSKDALLRAKFIANECIKVCKACGVHMAVRHGYDHGNLLYFETKEEMEVKDWIFKKIWEPHRALKASMLQDLEKGRKCEIDYINGLVCELGEMHFVETPVNKQVVTVIKAIEQGQLKSEWKNLKMIEIPEF